MKFFKDLSILTQFYIAAITHLIFIYVVSDVLVLVDIVVLVTSYVPATVRVVVVFSCGKYSSDTMSFYCVWVGGAVGCKTPK